MSVEIRVGKCQAVLGDFPERYFHCAVTSPPYYQLRNYGHEDQRGSEATPEEYVYNLVEDFRAVHRVLRDDGTLWLNLGDTYNAYNGNRGPAKGVNRNHHDTMPVLPKGHGLSAKSAKQKDMLGIPWSVALALRADGWYLRDAVIWHKPSGMPGSQKDRCTTAYEFLFQLTKQPRYFFDMEAVREKAVGTGGGTCFGKQDADATDTKAQQRQIGSADRDRYNETRTPRNVWAPTWTEEDVRALVEFMNLKPPTSDVWKIAHEGCKEAHFATFPRDLPTRCIKASTSEKGCCPLCGAPWGRVDATCWSPGCECYPISLDGETHPVDPCRVLDPFNGAGTTGIAAELLCRDYFGVELVSEYASMSLDRIARAMNPATVRTDTQAPAPPLFSTVDTDTKERKP